MRLLNRCNSLTVADTRKISPAVWTPIGKLTAFQDASVAEGMLTTQPPNVLLLE